MGGCGRLCSQALALALALGCRQAQAQAHGGAAGAGPIRRRPAKKRGRASGLQQPAVVVVVVVVAPSPPQTAPGCLAHQVPGGQPITPAMHGTTVRPWARARPYTDRLVASTYRCMHVCMSMYTYMGLVVVVLTACACACERACVREREREGAPGWRWFWRRWWWWCGVPKLIDDPRPATPPCRALDQAADAASAPAANDARRQRFSACR